MIVYALADPDTLEVRYVGQTVRPIQRRLAQHKRSAGKRTTPPVNAWLRGLGKDPAAIEIESFSTGNEMFAGEIFWIEQFRAMGARLLNIAPGGASRAGSRHSEEQKAKWRLERRGENASHFGRKHSEATKSRLSTLTAKWIALHGNPNKGRKASAETRLRISAARRGIRPNFSEDGKRRRSEAARRNWSNPSYREMMTRPGLSNPMATPVIVDGRAYAQNELAKLLGVSRCLVQKRIAAANGAEMTMSDFARKTRAPAQ